MKSIQDVQYRVKYKAPLCLIFDYEGVLSSYAKTFSAESFNPMIKRVLENYAKKDYIKVVILIKEEDKKILKKLKMSAKNLEFEAPENLEMEVLYKNMDEKMRLVYFGEEPSVIKKMKQNEGTIVCVDSRGKDCNKKADFFVTQGQLEEFIIQTNNLYL